MKKLTHPLRPRTTRLFSRLAGIVAGSILCSQALSQTPLETYDAAIAADASLSSPLIPAAMLTTPVVLTGANGAAFDFGATADDVTMEFILKGNPAASVSSFLAVGTNNPKSRLVFESWPDTAQLGFTQGGVADYLLAPGVASPTNDTHVAFVWEPSTKTMKVYVNGALAGSTTDVSANFAMPTGWGWLGAADQNGDEGMSGTVSRVTVYDSILSEGAIKRHSSAFGAHVASALAAYDQVISTDATSGLAPTAKMVSTVVLNGMGGADFDFQANADDVTMEFILEGDPAANNSAFLAVGENSTSSLRFELWDNTGQMGFTQLRVADYSFTPGVNSPALPMHITYAWNAAAKTMKLYINGVLGGTTTGVDADFAMPYGQGRLGNEFGGGEPMLGAIYRVTVYDSLLDEDAILRHGKAFGDLLSPPEIIAFTITPESTTPGGSAMLRWTVKNATKVLINGIDRTSLTNLSVSSLVSTPFTLTAQNSLGGVSAQLRLQVNPDLTAYDAAITADAGQGLIPVAKLTSPLTVSGSWSGVPFNFGTNSGDGTVEFILEGDPNPGSGTAIATDYAEEGGTWRHSLRYSQWPNAWQIGFTKRAVEDYTFTPLVPSPNWPTHLAFVWDAAAATMRVYVNGSLAGENTAVDPAFGLPSGQGTLGDGMSGAIFRVTVYTNQLGEEKILSHSKAFLAGARPTLNAYDNAIEASAAGGLKPSARLLAPVTLTGEGGVRFWFGTNSDNATIEFVLEGDPTTSVSSFLAVGVNNTASRLTYEAWPDTGQMGFTQGGVDDYLTTPGVPSPQSATHVTFAWNASATTMRIYVNGTLAGTRSGVSSAFALPSEAGVLGDSQPTGEPMTGVIHRVTTYDSLLEESVILAHGQAFAAQPPALALNVSGGLVTVLLTQGMPGQHYQVEYRDSLDAGGTWTLLQDIPALSGTTATVPDPTPIAGRTSRYYRALLVR
jgi:hypothetical protein